VRRWARLWAGCAWAGRVRGVPGGVVGGGNGSGEGEVEEGEEAGKEHHCVLCHAKVGWGRAAVSSLS